MTDPKPDLVKMAREALNDYPIAPDTRISVLAREQADVLRDLARAVIDQLAPKPVKVGQWVVVDKHGCIVAFSQSEKEARDMALGSNRSLTIWHNGPYRAIYVTGEEGVRPE